jgi:transposase-like protein
MRYTFKQFKAEYPNDAACLDKIMDIQYGGREFSCPGCGADSKFHRIAKRRAYSCQHCGHHIYPCVGTPFEKSRTPLTNWFFAMYLMTSTRHGVAAKELERQIGCTYKTAWRMAHELRKLMAQADDHRPMSGHVEIDETVVGGKQTRREREAKGDNKTIVMGIVERGGIIRAGPIQDATMDTLEAHVLHNVQRGSIVSTDEWSGYKQLHKAPYLHGTVNHSAKEYVRGIHHVNTLESHWSLFHRAVRGTHVHISAKHMWKYVSEFSYRRNFRKSHRAMFDRLVDAFSLPRLQES